MNYRQIAFIGIGVFVVTGILWASSNTLRGAVLEGSDLQASARVAHAAPARAAMPAPDVPAAVAAMAPVEKKGDLALVPPPTELPQAPTDKMITSVSPTAMAEAVKTSPAKTSAKGKAASKIAPKAAVAKVRKPQKLFSYCRLLNFSPHPQEEEFLKDKPLTLNGKNYHFTVSYKESWKVVDDDLGYLKKLGFEIILYQDENKIRTLKIPQVAIDPAKIKSGQVLGIAEVAPYRFNISVDSFTLKNKQVSEIVFKLDLIG